MMQDAISVDGQPITDQQAKLLSNQIPLDSIQGLKLTAEYSLTLVLSIPKILGRNFLSELLTSKEAPCGESRR